MNPSNPNPESPSAPGGVIHTYQKYDPQRLPLPRPDAPDLVTPAFEHMLAHGNMREWTEEELAEAIELDPSQIAGLGPSIGSLLAMLEERKRKILATYETDSVRKLADAAYKQNAAAMKPPSALRKAFEHAIRDEQIRDLERIWFRSDEDTAFGRGLVKLIEHLGHKYEIEELAAKYAFTGRTPMTIEQAIAVKEELETIDRLIAQLKEAAKNAKLYLINLDELGRFAEEAQLDEMAEMQRRVADLLREMAEQQGLKREGNQYKLTPKAFKLFQNKLLKQIFSQLQASRTGRHDNVVTGDGAVEMQRTKPYEFGDSLANLDVVASVTNAIIRTRTEPTTPVVGPPYALSEPTTSQIRLGGQVVAAPHALSEPTTQVVGPDSETALGPHANATHARTAPITRVVGSDNAATRTPLRLLPDDLEIHRTRNSPKCATVVCMDMSGSMRWGGQYINVKRMALALHGLIRTDYPGDFVDFVEICTLPRRRHVSEILELLPRPVTTHDPWVRLKADMSDPDLSEAHIHPHFTNIQRSLSLARQMLQVQDTPNRQIFLITDGLPTAHFEDNWLYMLYPPDARTEHFTLREGLACREQGITINVFLLQNWNQSHEDIQFAQRLAEGTTGRVIFTAGKELDRFVVWDYVQRRRSIVG